MSAVSGNYSPRVIGTIFLISFGIYLFLATVTYTPFDPGWMYVSSDTRQVSNASGVVGAWIADMLYGLFGWAALLLPFFLFVEAVQVWWPRSYLTPVFRYAAQFFILLTTAALLYFIWQLPNLSLTQASGGIIGYEIARSLTHLLTAPLGIILLTIFWFVLWTLAFKIEWLKTGQMLRNIPGYLQDLFYKNVPEEEEDFDLTIAKSKQSLSTMHQSNTTPVQEHSPIEDDEEANAVLDKQNLPPLHELESKIVNQPKIAIKHTEHNIQVEKVVQTGEVWRAQNATPQQEIVAPQPEVIEEKITPVIAKPTVQVHDQQVEDISELIAEADRHLQDQPNSRQQATSSTVKTAPIQAAHVEPSMLDWADDEIFDELLAAVPLNPNKAVVQTGQNVSSNDDQQSFETQKPSMQKQDTQHQIVHADLSDLSEFDHLFDEPELQNSTSKIQAMPTAAVIEKPELSKEEFIEAWRETAGKPEEFDWDDLDAPLTDAAGRPVSRAMQVAEKRKYLSPLPGLDLLDPVDLNKKVNFTAEQLSRLSELLELKLQDFNVKAKVIEAHPGPVVTRFELDLAPGVKASKVTNISRDLARSMSMASVRVVEVIPGKPYIGIEVPNSSREMVRLIELLETDAYRDPNALLSMAMGKDISGNPVLADLAKAPHMLVAGTTGSGKSVAVNSMLLSMLLKYKPEQLRLIMIDPKQLELANYNDIPHLLTPVVTDMKDAVSALNWCVNEMERRYKLMSLLKVRKLMDYNRKVEEALVSGEDLIDPTWKPDDSATQSRAPRLQPMPLIVIVADEFADMIMQVGKKAEEMITRLAQKSRAAGIHLLLATQRPTVDVVTGLIKANIPTRAALRVNSKLDSRTILDAGGAEDLLGHGDMLFLGPGKIEPERVHGAFISDDEVNRICDAWRERGSPNYVDEILTPYDEESSSSGDYDSGADGGSDRDMLYDQCVAFVLETRKASASSLQRKFSLGYNRAARIIDQMEENGIVSPLGANGKRDIIV